MKWVKQLAVIMTISFLAELMEILIPLPIAASVYGLILMLAGLITKMIPLEKVEDAADFLIEIMPILFVPPTVGLIADVEALRQMLIPLFVTSIATTILIMAVTGRVSQGIMRRSFRGRQESSAEGPEGLWGEPVERDSSGRQESSVEGPGGLWGEPVEKDSSGRQESSAEGPEGLWGEPVEKDSSGRQESSAEEPEGLSGTACGKG